MTGATDGDGGPSGCGQGGVLVAGAINTDLVARVRAAPGPGETVTGRDFRIFGGGKGANQALAAARSGARTTILGALGDDDFGRQRLADLQADAVDIAHVTVLPGVASGVALIAVEDSGENRILYVPGATAEISADAAERAIRAAGPAVVLATLEPPGDALERLLTVARELGVPVALSATPEPLEGRDFAARADVLIVNETEACQLLGIAVGDQPWPAVVAGLVAIGPRTAIVTLGEEGAIVLSGGKLAEIPAPKVEVVDTTGAGDAFSGAFAARLAEGADPIEAARSGVAAGSFAVTKPGAQPSMPRRSDVESMLARMGAAV
jgi:ribokinase